MPDPTLTTDAERITGAKVVDITHRLEDVLTVALMTPMGRSGPVDPNCKWGLPLNIWGLPATAKSDKIRQAGEKAGLPVSVVYPSQNQPEDFGNLPVVLFQKERKDDQGNTFGGEDMLHTVCFLPQINELNALGKGILFVDEGSTAPPTTQASMLSMVLERKVGSTPIAPAVRILLAANPPEHAVGGYPYEPAFANRMAHGYVGDPPHEHWWDYLVRDSITQTMHIGNLTAQLIANWPNARPYAVTSIIGFTKANPDKIRQQPPKGNPQASYAWASMRTWDMAGKALAAAKALGQDDEMEEIIIDACVGEGVGNEWAAWKAAADLPEPKDVLTKGWAPDKDRLDRTLAVSSGITSFVLHQPTQADKYKYAERAWEWFGPVIKDAGLGDIVAPQCQALLVQGLGGSRGKSPDSLKNAARPALAALDDLGISTLIKTK